MEAYGFASHLLISRSPPPFYLGPLRLAEKGEKVEVDLERIMGGSDSKPETEDRISGGGQRSGPGAVTQDDGSSPQQPGDSTNSLHPEGQSPMQGRVRTLIASKTTFLGLENYGNTCYCNAVLQLLLNCDPIRQRLRYIYCAFYDPTGQASPGEGSPYSTGPLATAEGSRGDQALNGSAQLGSSSSSPVVSPIVAEPSQSGNNKDKSSAQTAKSTGPLNPAKRSPDESILGRLSELCYLLDTSKKKKGSLGPSQFVQKMKRENVTFRNSMQQDAHEFLMYILNDIIETERKLLGLGPHERSPLQRMFEGETVSETTCMECETTSSRPEPFVALSIDVEQNYSLARCFQNFSHAEYLMGDDKFKCTPCSTPTIAKKAIKLHVAPQLLLVHLKRFKFVESRNAFRKLAHRIVFSDQLGLPFHHPVHPDDAVGARPTATAGQGGSRPLEFSAGGNPSPGLPSPPQPAEAVNRNPRMIHYRLCGFVVHHGAGLNVGHYIACCRTDISGSVWRKYDDDVVTIMQESDIEQYFGYTVSLNESSVTSTAYILLYALQEDV